MYRPPLLDEGKRVPAADAPSVTALGSKKLGTSENLSRGPGIQSLTSNCDLRRFYVAGLLGKDGPKSFSERLISERL
jgi:hypothetical protein